MLLNRTRQLLGFAKAPTAIPLIEGSRAVEGSESIPESQPEWHDDLESLFRMVDSRITERRAIISSPPQAHLERRELPTPPDHWVGFGLEDPAAPAKPAAASAAPGAVGQLAAHLVTLLRASLLEGELTGAIRQAARDAVEDALRDRLGAEVRAGVEAALRDAAAGEDEERALKPSTIVSIRIRFRRAAPARSRHLTLRSS